MPLYLTFTYCKYFYVSESCKLILINLVNAVSITFSYDTLQLSYAGRGECYLYIVSRCTVACTYIVFLSNINHTGLK